MFEYKVRCRHKLGWKEIKLYADTDIEEFFNRNSIDYVRNITDTAEHRQLKEIERLKDLCNKYEEEHKTAFEEWKKAINIIKEFEDWLNAKYEEMHDIWYIKVLNKLQELKGVDKE